MSENWSQTTPHLGGNSDMVNEIVESVKKTIVLKDNWTNFHMYLADFEEKSNCISIF